VAETETETFQPRILVEYRYRGIPASVVAALLILTAALGIASHRRLTPPRLLSLGPVAPRVAAVPITKPLEPVPAPPPAEARNATEPLLAMAKPVETLPDLLTETQVPVPDPASIVEAPRESSAAPPQTSAAPEAMPEPLPNPRPGAAPETLPEPPQDPRPSAEEVDREIQREAAEREAEMEEMKRLKPEARRLQELEAPVRAHDQRIAFRKELYQILKAGGNDAGPRIDALCDQYGREVPTDQRTAVTKRLRHASDRSTRQDRVALLRAYDVPEPAILDDLARYWDKRIRNARGGVRDHEEVRVKAAWQLLSFPLPPRPRSPYPDR